MNTGRAASLLASATALLMLLSGCAWLRTFREPAPAPVVVESIGEAGPPQPAISAEPSPPPLPTPIAFSEAVARAGEKLLAEAQAAIGSKSRELIIDPLIDSSTGQQTAGTVAMGQQMAALIKVKAPSWSVRPLTRASLANGPLLLIGTLTAVNTRNSTVEPADAFRLCLVLIDLRTGRLIAKKVDRATAETVNAEPTPPFRDSPTWNRDKTVVAYIKSCQGSSAGDTVDPAYLIRLPAAALLNEALLAHGDGKLAAANRLYRDAQLIAEPDDLRVLNGLYLTNWRLGKKKEAGDAFAKIVAAGLDSKHLPMKILFNPGSTTLLQNADLQLQYALWLRELASQVGARETCMKVIGHTSKTGSPIANEFLSQRRAAVIRQGLQRQDSRLAQHITSDGAGSRENLIGLGTDDLRDALDRRVEFETVDCS